MFLKKKLKMYLVMLSILALSAPINAMKKDEINENIIKTNEIKKQDFEEEDSKNNIEINKIKKEIYEIKENLKNNLKCYINQHNVEYYINQYIDKLKKHEENLLSLKEKINNKITIGAINNMLYKINTLYSKLIILKIKIEINKIEKIDFTDESIDNIIYYQLNLNQCEKNLLSLKEKIDNERIIDTINNMLDKINTLRNDLYISKIKTEIDKIKKEIYSEICDVKNLSTWIFILYDNRKGLLDLKQKTNNEETKNTINNMLDEIDNLIYDKVEIVRYIVNGNEKIKNSAKNPELK